MIYLLSESNICSLLDLDDHKNMDFYLKPVLSALSEKIKEHLKISDKKGKMWLTFSIQICGEDFVE